MCNGPIKSFTRYQLDSVYDPGGNQRELFDTLDSSDEIYWESIATKERLHKEREVHALELKNIKVEMERKLTEKDSAIAEKDNAIAEKGIRLVEEDNRIAALEHEFTASKTATSNRLESQVKDCIVLIQKTARYGGDLTTGYTIFAQNPLS